MTQFLKCEFNERTADILRINLSVQPVKLSADPVCDFCGESPITALYAASKTSTGEVRQCWRWAACGTCEAFIDNNAWVSVKKRIARRLRDMLKLLPTREIGRAVDVVFVEFLRDVIHIEEEK